MHIKIFILGEWYDYCMASEKLSGANKEGGLEKTSRFFRNINVVGAVACFGAAVALPPAAAVALQAYGAFNLAQAGGFEVARRWAKNRQRKRK